MPIENHEAKTCISEERITGSTKWKDVLLEDVASEITVGYVGPMASEYIKEGIPFLRSQNVGYLRVNLDDIKHISIKFHEKLKKSSLKPGDVVIVRTGKPGTCAVIPSWLPIANCSDLVIVRCNDKLDPDFLAYYVNSISSHHVAAHLVGAVQQHFNVESARKIELRLPLLEEQKAIVNVISALDSKIELNQRMNKTLESIGQAVFKSWFVDFEFPNQESKPYKSSGGQMIESDLREIPKGWKIGVFGDIAKKISKVVSSTEKKCYDKYVSLDDMPRKQIFLNHFSSVNDVDSSMIRFDERDILFGAMRPYFHKVCIAPFIGITRTTTFVIRGKDAAYQSYLAFLCFQKSTVDYADSTSVGSTIPYAVFEALERMPLIIPERQIALEYQNLVGPIIEKAWGNFRESLILNQIRDNLLPRLMSGKIRVPIIKEKMEPGIHA